MGAVTVLGAGNWDQRRCRNTSTADARYMRESAGPRILAQALISCDAADTSGVRWLSAAHHGLSAYWPVCYMTVSADMGYPHVRVSSWPSLVASHETPAETLMLPAPINVT